MKKTVARYAKPMTDHATRSSSSNTEVAARVGILITHALAVRGIDPGPLCATAGFDPEMAADPTARISLAVEQLLWESAAELSGDSDFGLHTAESLKPGAFDVLDYAVRSATTLGIALERLVRYSRLQHEPAIFRIVSDANVVRIEHSFRRGTGSPCRQEAEFTLASIVLIGTKIVEGGLKPVAVEFIHAKPSGTHDHARVFGTEPKFSAPVNALEFCRAMMDRPLVTADPVLSRIVERHAEALLNAIRSESLRENLRRALIKQLPQGRCSIAVIAPLVGMSERTLQRKLEWEGTSFGAVLDELRHDLALRYLKDGKMTLAEIAYLLGYSEPSPFHRAFRRWTGSTPQALRNNPK